MKYIVLIGLVVMTIYLPKNFRHILSTTEANKRELYADIKNFDELDNEYLTATSVWLAVFDMVLSFVFLVTSSLLVGSLWFTVVAICLGVRRLRECFALVEWSTDPYDSIPLLKMQIGVQNKVMSIVKVGYVAYLWMFLVSTW